MCTNNQESIGLLGKNGVAIMLERVVVIMVVIMEVATCKDMESMEVMEGIEAATCKDVESTEVMKGILGTWLLKGLLFSVITARCLVILIKNITKYMAIHLATGCTRTRGLQPL